MLRCHRCGVSLLSDWTSCKARVGTIVVVGRCSEDRMGCKEYRAPSDAESTGYRTVGVGNRPEAPQAVAGASS